MTEEAYSGPERRTGGIVTLSEEQMEDLAARAARKALENFYLEVGKITVRSALYIIGAVVLSGLAYLGLTGKVKL